MSLEVNLLSVKPTNGQTHTYDSSTVARFLVTKFVEHIGHIQNSATIFNGLQTADQINQAFYEM